MQEPTDLESGDRELEQALGRLKPAPPQALASDLWYRAGLAAGRRRMWFWQAIASMAAAAAIVVLLHRPMPQTITIERVVEHTETTPPAAEIETTSALPLANYLRLEAQIVDRGWDSLPQTPSSHYDKNSTIRAWPLNAADGTF